jgi:hypothetical protein
MVSSHGRSSNLVSATPLDQPLNLTISGVSATTVALEWVAPAKGILPIAYRVRYVDMETGVYQDVNQVPHVGSFLSKEAYTVTGLTNGRQYGFIVVAQAGTGAYSDNQVTPMKTTPMDVPSDVQVIEVTESSVRVQWQPARPVAGAVNPLNYELHYGGLVQVIPFAATDTFVHDLGGDKEYSFCLFIRAPAGDLIASHGACARAIPVNQVTQLRTIDSTNTSITLEWEAVTPVVTDVSYIVVASPIERALSAFSGQVSWVPRADRPTRTIPVLHTGPTAHTATFTNLSYSDIFSVQVFVVVGGSYTEPVGSNVLHLSPVGRATRTRLCYYDKTEVSIQWARPRTAPTPSRYTISYRPDGCTSFSWLPCDWTETTSRITHRGLPDTPQVSLSPHTGSATGMFEMSLFQCFKSVSFVSCFKRVSFVA